jgi:putative DNA-invertase from lambdoid prophage Rac
MSGRPHNYPSYMARPCPNVSLTATPRKALVGLGVEVVVLQLGKLDLTSPAGKLMLAMLAAVAEMERDLLIECTQSSLARIKAEGKTLGRPTKTIAAEREAMIEGRQASKG